MQQPNKPSHKLYILVDKTLTPSQQAVQACHAAIEFAQAYPEWEHQALVLLGLEGERELDKWSNWLAHQQGTKVTTFRESFWDGKLTAAACYGVDEYVKNLPLL